MQRRREAVEHENIDRWLVSYADFITLLFAFFVVMYAISSVNIGKYQIVSSTLDQVFHSENRSSKPIQVGDLARSPTEFTGYSDQGSGESDYPLESVTESIELGLETDLNDRNIVVREGKDTIEIEMKDSILFKTGGNELQARAIPLIRKIATILEPFPNAVRVEGFTDNIPIDNIFYPSNWDLSVARAAMITRTMARYGVDPTRLAAVGYGEYQPIADNNTAFGRRQNRRVIILIDKFNEVRPEQKPKTVKKPPKPAAKPIIPAEKFIGPLLPQGWTPPPLPAVEAPPQQLRSVPRANSRNDSEATEEATPTQPSDNQEKGDSPLEQRAQESGVKVVPLEDGRLRFIFE